MQLHTLQPRHKRIRSRTIGRGGKRGKTSGRGTKGQKARAGHKMRPELRDIIKKLPKLRGYRFHGIAKKPTAISLALVVKKFAEGDTVTVKKLRDRGLVRGQGAVKILGREKIERKLTIKGVALSTTAKESVVNAGGSVT